MATYSFGVPGLLIWIIHISVGLFLLYIGRIALNGGKINRNAALTLAILGSVASLYHSHLMLYDTFINKLHEEKYFAGRGSY